jgi:hypothetical protein
LNGVGGANAGPYIRFDKATVQKNLIGSFSGVISGTSDDLAYWSNTGAGHQWLVNGSTTSSMVLDTSGNVGIGTSSPAYKIDALGSSTSGSGIVNTLRLQHGGTSGGDGAKILFTAGTSTDGAGIGSGGVALNSADLRFYTGGNTERIRINAGAPILCFSGGNTSATGTGIAFPATQSASSDANTLDDYEEGTWTPAVAGSTGGTFAALSGKYTKIGRIVTCDFFLQLSGFTYTNNSAQFTVTGLPFVPEGFSYTGPTGSLWSQSFNFNNTESAGVDFVTPATTSSSTILFRTSGSGQTSGIVINNNNANPILTGQVVYTV